MASKTNSENATEGGKGTTDTDSPTLDLSADSSSGPIKPKRPRGRKGSLMLTPGGFSGLGSAPCGPMPTNITLPPNTVNHDVTATSTTIESTTDSKDTGDSELPVDLPTSDNARNVDTPESALEDKITTTTTTTNTPTTLLSGDHHVSMLLKAEIEGNARQVADLQRRGSCMIRPGGIGGLGMEGFQDNDSDDDEPIRRPSQPGSADHRPLVGGFAAAAYEAAREYHYSQQKTNSQKKNDDDNSNAERNMPLPSI